MNEAAEWTHILEAFLVGKEWGERFVVCERVDWSLYGPFKIGEVNWSDFSRWSGRENNSQ